ncbi:Yip1 family protein [Asticcacaulis solisilvae]|uniref:Yip1 family protein n=1 Tax=Asticcacaulis solisilvae TaxID=1217274 RepID=UPI003FD889F9
MTDIVSRPASAGLVARVQNILLKPSATWDEIAAEPSSIKSIYMGYVVPLAAIGPVAQAIGLTVFGINAIIVSYRVPLLWAVSQAIVAYVLTLVMVYVQALIIEALAPNFGGTKDRLNAFKVSAYSWTAAWVAGIFGILPMLGILGILGFYSLYLMYRGLPKLMKAPEDKAVAYTAVVVIVTIVLAAIVFGISGAVGRMGMMGATGPLGMATTPRAAGVVTVPGMGSMDVGKMQAATEQMAAQASAMQNGTATPVKTADPQALLALMPANFMGAARSDTSTDSGGAGGMNVANAEASYVVNGNSLRLKVTDMGGMSGFGAMAQAVNVNHTRTTDTGYEKVESKDGRVVSETWDNQAKSGKYSILAGSRITVEAEGGGVDMATLKNLVNAVDLGRAQALAAN